MSHAPLRVAVILSTLLWSFIALAATPANISGLSATFANGQVTVQWDVPEGATDIAAYRIYYGQKSILESGGAYDDFATTDGRSSQFAFPTLPPYPQIFIAVTAVDGHGEESSSFTEEVQLDLTSGNQSSHENTVSPVTATVIPSTVKSARGGGLSNSGIPLIGVMLVSGGIAGWKKMRRSTMEQLVGK